jgi:O-antigen/teichoic acid export membrane protein
LIQKMSLRKIVIMNAGSNWMSQFVNAVIVFIFIRIIPHSLGWESYGVWALLSTGLRYPMILENAFSLSTNRFVAFYHNDSEELNRYVSASFLILFLLSVLTITSAILLSFFVSDIFTAITNDLAFEAQITCILVGMTLAMKILEAAFSGALMGYQYHTRYNSIASAANVFRFIITVIALRYWQSMIAVQLAFASSASVSLISVFYVTRKSIPGFKINILKVRKRTIRELFRYTGHATARSGSMIFMYSTLALLIGKVGSAENVSVYDIASRISGFINGLLAGAQNVFLPAVTKLFADRQVEKIKAVIKKGTNISSIITCAILIMLFIYAKEILQFLLKEMYLPQMVPVLQVMMLSVVPRGFFGIWIPSLAGMGHLREMTITALSAVAGAVALELILLKGIVRVPMAPAIAQMVALWGYMGIWLPFYGLYKCNVPLYEYIKSSLLGPLKATVTAVVILLILNNVVPPDSVHWMIMFLISGIIVFLCFGLISLRSETTEMFIMLKRKFST